MTMSQWIFIEPQDVWLFRDGRPFSEGGTARSVFPPSPQTIQGALRALLLHHSGVAEADYRNTAGAAIHLQIGHPPSPMNALQVMPGDLGAFSMRGPYLARREGKELIRFTPLPSDIVREKNTRSLMRLQPARDFGGQSDLTDELTTWRPLVSADNVNETEEVEASWLDEYNLARYGQATGEFGNTLTQDLFQSESRLGIGMDIALRRPKESYLYQVEFTRLQNNVGLLVQLTGTIQMPATSGWMALGGEARAARFTVVPNSEVQINPVSVAQTRLKLVLLTPSFFTSGWQPSSCWSHLFNGQSVRLISIAVRRAQLSGGWDIARRWHKTSYPLVPAGSVYFFEADQPIPVPTHLTETPINELPYPAMGFGCVASGSWNYATI